MAEEKYFGHTSKKKYTKEENLRFWKLKRDYLLENIVRDETELGVKHPATFLLDSSLITQTNFKKYTHKVIYCGKYLQVYQYSDSHDKKISKKDKVVHREKMEKDFVERSTSINSIILEDTKIIELNNSFETSSFYKNLNSKNIDDEIQLKKEKNKNKEKYKTIDIKNINRSKNEMQRLIKTNEDDFKTFITLTFEENIIDIDKANKKFNIWRTYIKRLKNDFKYVCVPEFQKRGAVHYHLLTNIDYTDFSLLSKDERHIWSKEDKCWQIGRDVVGWSYGINMAKDMKDENVVGYLTKYMTKDIDDRLWGHRRYLYSQNLKKPSVSYLDLETADVIDFLTFQDNIKNYTENYKNVYADKFGQVIEFQEFKRKEVFENV